MSVCMFVCMHTLYMYAFSLISVVFDSRVSVVARSSYANQSNGSAGHGSTGQSLKGSIKINGKSSVDDTSKQENAQSDAAVAALSPHIQTLNVVTISDLEKSMPSCDQIPTSSMPGVDSSSDSPLAPSISLDNGDGATNGEVGSLKLVDGLNEAVGNKVVLHEVGELPASTTDLNSTKKKKSPNKSNEVEENHLSEISPTSPSSYHDSMRSSSCGSQASRGNAIILSLLNL